MTSPQSAPNFAIAATNLTLSLGTGEAAVEILRGIDLTVPQGQTLALLGPSGSGKSSLMAVLSGLERASGGALHVAGENFAALDEDALAAAGRTRADLFPDPARGQFADRRAVVAQG
ncbi:MAG: ATP-binding cassette domain-containing protein, partial [Novosphingobium sp.]